jgi:hypothetical protein
MRPRTYVLSLRDHAELASELTQLENLLNIWQFKGGPLTYFGKSHPVTRAADRVYRDIGRLLCQLDTVWCQETDRDSGLPYYSAVALRALVDLTGYCPRILPESIKDSAYERLTAVLRSEQARRKEGTSFK